jgi:hypothetical protein
MALPLTEEQKQRRAEIARANGRKSKGPVTAAGKHRSSLNAISVGTFVEVHEAELPPFVAQLDAAHRKTYIKLYQDNLRHYEPNTEHERWMVRTLSAEQFHYDYFSKIEILLLNADRDRAGERKPDLNADQLELAAFERYASGDRALRTLDRKKRQHLAAAEKLSRLLLRLRKERPLSKNEPVSPTVHLLAKPMKNIQVTGKKENPAAKKIPFLLTKKSESVTFNQQRKRSSRA